MILILKPSVFDQQILKWKVSSIRFSKKHQR